MAKALIVVAALLASVAFAQTCDTVTNNVYRSSACAGYTACATTLCSCSGNAGTSETCLSAATANCASFNTCVHSFFRCLDGLADTARLNTSDPCNGWAVTLHAQLLTATVGTYNGSTLQMACGARACELKNRTSLGTACSMGTNYSMVCMAPPTTAAATTTSAPATTAPVYVVRVTIRLSGNWSAVVNNATALAELKTALAADIAALLGIDVRYVEIITVVEGSLVVDFAVREGSNASVSQLENRAAQASTGSTWLSSTKAVAAANGIPTSSISVTVTIVTTTVAGQTTTAPSTSSSAASVSAALVAVVALFGLLF